MASRFAAVLLLAFLCLFVCSCSGQLNFSTGWGKRALGVGSGVGSPAGAASSSSESTSCKASVDSLMMIYKLIQNEAQKLLDCEKFN